MEEALAASYESLGLTKCQSDSSQGCMLSSERLIHAYMQGVLIASLEPSDDMNSEFNNQATTIRTNVTHRAAMAVNHTMQRICVVRKQFRLEGKTDIVQPEF